MEGLRAQSFTWRGTAPGPALLMFGGVHGNETCGTAALARLRLELDLGILELRSGSLTMVPVCNPLAYRAGRRFVHENLNRIIAPGAVRRHEEHDYAAELMRLIDRCDVLLDLHSYSSGSLPYVFLDYPSPFNRAMAAALEIDDWVTGWVELYAKTPALNAGDTTQYANETGKHGILVECGQHDDPAAAAIAYACARQTLAHLDMLASDGVERRPAQARITRVHTLILKERAGAFAKPWRNFDPVVAGDPLIVYDDGEILAAADDAIILLPDPIAPPGAEWIYLGRSEPA